MDEQCEWFSNGKSSALGCCLTFAQIFANLSLTLLIKVLLIKKACNNALNVLVEMCYNKVHFSFLV